MTTKTYGTEEVRTNMPGVLDAVVNGETEAIIEQNGEPAAVVISYKRWQQIEQDKARKLQRFADARKRMDRGDFLTQSQVETQLKADGFLP